VVMTAGHAGDFARRVAHRREQLGLSREEIARRSGMDSGYLEYLERSAYVELPPGVLMRLAAALETTLPDLTGGTVELPPGAGGAGAHPLLEVLSKEQSEAHLTDGGVGRLVFIAERGPVALPVNFHFVDGDIVFRTSDTGSLLTAVGGTVSFEVDHIDEVMSQGWSVLITGRARRVVEPSELEQLAQLGIDPWAGGSSEAVIRIETIEISGRNIRQRD
jgi:nitroimidazol reductase NimA-like FMN-containing flavoprotein (pyridoxamine 5'-phosphate oxidase superfamily)